MRSHALAEDVRGDFQFVGNFDPLAPVEHSGEEKSIGESSPLPLFCFAHSRGPLS
jgi:hypothetical protein